MSANRRCSCSRGLWEKKLEPNGSIRLSVCVSNLNKFFMVCTDYWGLTPSPALNALLLLQFYRRKSPHLPLICLTSGQVGNRAGNSNQLSVEGGRSQ